MKLIKRVAWYSGGFVIGIIILMFFLGGKKTSCDYGPNARTLKNIRSKQLQISPEAQELLRQHSLDSTAILEILKKGDVLFGESDTAKDSCKVYVLQGEVKTQHLKFSVENCEKTANIGSLKIDTN